MNETTMKLQRTQGGNRRSCGWFCANEIAVRLAAVQHDAGKYSGNTPAIAGRAAEWSGSRSLLEPPLLASSAMCPRWQRYTDIACAPTAGSFGMRHQRALCEGSSVIPDQDWMLSELEANAMLSVVQLVYSEVMGVECCDAKQAVASATQTKSTSRWQSGDILKRL